MEIAEKTQGIEQPAQPNWTHWRERGFCRLWQAVMLSLNLEPTVRNREIAKAGAPERYQEYRRRLQIAKVRYGFHDSLKPLAHPFEGRTTGDRYLELNKFLTFANDLAWRDLTPLRDGMQRPSESNTDNEPAHAFIDGEETESEDEVLATNDTLVRMGALLKVLENCLTDEKSRARQSRHPLLKENPTDNPLNELKLAERMVGVIQQSSNDSAKPIRNFGKETIRKELRAARAALQTCTKSTPR